MPKHRWSDECLGYACAKFDAGWTYPEIRDGLHDEFGFATSTAAVWSRIRDCHGLAYAARKTARVGTRQAKIDEAYRLSARRATVAEMGERLGDTFVRRNIDKSDRRDLRDDAEHREFIAARKFEALLRRYPLPPIPPSPVRFGGLTLLQLTESQCRWPLDESPAGEHIFCGQPRENRRRSYCAAHNALSIGSAA